MHEAAKILRVTYACVYAYTTTGCRGTVLESRQIGAKRCTSLQALERFSNSLPEPEKIKATKASILRRQKVESRQGKEMVKK